MDTCKESLSKRLLNVKTFVACLSFAIFTSSAYRAYCVASITTIEMEFHIRSSQAGLWLSSFDITHVLVVMVVAYIAGLGHIPRILGVCLLLAAGFLCLGTLPHFLFGGSMTVETKNDTFRDFLCYADSSPLPHSDCNSTGYDTTKSSYAILVTVNVLVGLTLSGLYSLGITYIDDNSSNRHSPHYMGIVYSMYAIGHVSGYGLGAVITSMKDSYGVAPWWIGFVILGGITLLPVAPFTFLPKRIDQDPTEDGDTTNNWNTCNGESRSWQLLRQSQPMSEIDGISLTPTLKGLLKAVRRLICNPVYMGINLMLCAQLNAGVILGSFFPKYLREEFGQHDWVSNLITALVGVAAAFGLYLGGFIVTRFKLSVPHTAKMICGAMVFVLIHYIIRTLIGCDTGRTVSIHSSDGRTCGATCHCSQNMFLLVCGSDNVTYRSPCHAGCNSSQADNEFSNCACVSDILKTAASGPCHDQPCLGMLWLYVALSVAGVIVSASSTIPATVISLRSIHTTDKALSLAMHTVMTSLLGFIPGPILAGVAVDRACDQWQTKTCDSKSMFCRAYDPVKLRVYYHVFGCVAATVSFLLSAFVARKCSSSITFYSDREDAVVLQSSISDDETNYENVGNSYQYRELASEDIDDARPFDH